LTQNRALVSNSSDAGAAPLWAGAAHKHGRRLWFDLALLGTAIIWGSAFAAQRVAAAHVGPFLYNGIRFLLGALVLAPILVVRGARPTGTEWRGGLLAGAILVGAAVLQQAGLKFTTAGKAAFVTGLYVILVPLFMALGWRRWPRKVAWVASLMAVVGLYLLSAQGRLALAPGDGLELAGAVLWACHVILIDRLVGRVNTLRLAVIQYVACGLACSALGLAFETPTLAGLPAAWWAVAYGGVVSVGIGYTLQVIGQKGAPAADAALVLSLEGVFAAFFGWWFLSERLTPRQLLGCGLMLSAMFLVQLAPLRGHKRPGAEMEETR
jgi:drug/metabolite transporter (DMT)-like permease